MRFERDDVISIDALLIGFKMTFHLILETALIYG